MAANKGRFETVNYKKEYPIGMRIKSYPSSYGNFPAEVIGYRTEKNLNTNEKTPIVRVLVHGTTEDGKEADFEEGFSPSYAPIRGFERLQKGQNVIVDGREGVITFAGRTTVKIFIPPSPKPRKLFGRFVVGQWGEKIHEYVKVQGHGWQQRRPSVQYRDSTIEPGGQVDYQAWLDAFGKEYSES